MFLFEYNKSVSNGLTEMEKFGFKQKCKDIFYASIFNSFLKVCADMHNQYSQHACQTPTEKHLCGFISLH